MATDRVASNIKKLRNFLGLSQSKFGERVGISRDVIANLEYDRLQSIDTKMPLLRLIAKEFGVSLDWLMTGEGDPELPDQTEAEQAAALAASMLDSEDPVVLAFISWWSRQSDTDRKRITQQVIDFAEELKSRTEEK